MFCLKSAPLVPPRAALLMATMPQAAHTFSYTCTCLQGLHPCIPRVHTHARLPPVCTCTHAMDAHPHHCPRLHAHGHTHTHTHVHSMPAVISMLSTCWCPSAGPTPVPACTCQGGGCGQLELTDRGGEKPPTGSWSHSVCQPHVLGVFPPQPLRPVTWYACEHVCLWTRQHVPFFLPGVGAPVCLGGLWPGSAQICSRGLGSVLGASSVPCSGCEVKGLPDTPPLPPMAGQWWPGGQWGLGPTWAGKAHFKSGGQHRDKLARRPGMLSSDCCSAQRGAGMCPPHG